MRLGASSVFGLRAASQQPPCFVARMAGVVSFIAGHLRTPIEASGCRRDLIAQPGCRPAALVRKASILPRRLTALEPGRYAPAGSRDAVLYDLKNPWVQFLHVRPALRGPLVRQVQS